MNVNEKHEVALRIIHEISGSLLAASKDGKIDASEAIAAVLGAVPNLMILVKAGN
jgi:hypothetical protein